MTFGAITAPCKLLFFCTGALLSILHPAASCVAGEADNWKVKHPEWIWCDDFETDQNARYFEYNMAGGQVSRAAGCGLDGSTGMRTIFKPGAVDVGWMKLAFGRTPSRYFKPVDGGTANYREIYWRVYAKYSSGWIGGGGAKMSRATVMATPGWAQAAFAHVWSAGPEDAYLYLDPARGTDAAGKLKTTKYNDFPNMFWLGAVGSKTPIFDHAHIGAWHCFEAHMKLNDPGKSNGVFELWIDGALEAQATRLNWLGSYSDYGINMVFLENYWNAGSPQEQERFLDNFVISTRPIGMIAPEPHAVPSKN